MKKRLRKKLSKAGQWFSVKTLFECQISGEPAPEKADEHAYTTHRTFEESIFLIQATSVEDAYTKAKTVAKKAEVSYLNVYEQQVDWVLIELLDCFEITGDTVQSGSEVYARFFEVPKEK